MKRYLLFVVVVGWVPHVKSKESKVLREAREPYEVSACPATKAHYKFGVHDIPKHVFYTGKFDAGLRNLTYGKRGRWPADMDFHFYDNEKMDASMQEISGLMRKEIPDLYEAFAVLRPWAFKADLWRYCILWMCGGIYVDSKMAIAEPFEDFLDKMGFNERDLASSSSEPQLYSCRTISACETVPKHKCVWQGLLISEARSEALMKTIIFVVKQIQARWYPPREYGQPWLFLTGPGAMSLATQTKEDQNTWAKNFHLNCRLMFATEHPRTVAHLVGEWRLTKNETGKMIDGNFDKASFVSDENLHTSQRTNDYGILFKIGFVYMDDPWPYPPPPKDV